MKHYGTDKLISHLNAKGISCVYKDKKLFKKYDYYQVINAYKSLFIDRVEDIDEMINNIDNDFNNSKRENIDRYKKNFNIKVTNANDFKNKLLDKLFEKYGFEINKNMTLNDKINKIKSINYVHHVYKPNTKYSDFVRMYEFEHSLRSILLKYTLIIEENIKKNFICVLNDYGNEDTNVNSDFLVNIANYNTSDQNSYAIESLKKVIDLHGDNHYKPIIKKRKQNVIIPYWIIINEMTLGQTIKTIRNIKENIKNRVFQKCLNEFTKIQIDIYDTSKNSQQINNEKSSLQTFENILKHIGDFRNILAHNQPLYSFNVKNVDLSSFPFIEYELPIPGASAKNNPLGYQNRSNANFMAKFKEFYGQDSFNNRTSNVHIDLSWMIYAIKKIVTNLGYTDFGMEIVSIYRKYNMLQLPIKKHVTNIDKLEKLLDFINNTSCDEFDSHSIVKMIEEKSKYKSRLHSEYGTMKRTIRRIKNMANSINIANDKSKYLLFPNHKDYKLYTNIDNSFLLLILS